MSRVFFKEPWTMIWDSLDNHDQLFSDKCSVSLNHVLSFFTMRSKPNISHRLILDSIWRCGWAPSNYLIIYTRGRVPRIWGGTWEEEVFGSLLCLHSRDSWLCHICPVTLCPQHWDYTHTHCHHTLKARERTSEPIWIVIRSRHKDWLFLDTCLAGLLDSCYHIAKLHSTWH